MEPSKTRKITKVSKAVHCRQFCTNCGSVRRHIVIRNPRGLDDWKCIACGALKTYSWG